MDITLHINLYLFPIILLIIIIMMLQKNVIQTMDNRLFRTLLLFTFLMLCADFISWALDGWNIPGGGQIVFAANFLYFAILPISVMLWLNYVYYYLKKCTIFSMSLIKKILLFTPMTIYYVMLILTAVTEWFFKIDDANYYVRGRFFYIPYFTVGLYILIAMIMMMIAAVTEKVSYRKKQHFLFVGFMMLPIIASVFQIMVYDIWIVMPITAIVELLVYVQIQKQQITIDALTGINNRVCFDNYLKNQIERREDGQSYYLFLMDMDCFKQINDTYGHTMGDEALIKTASILNHFFHNSKSFVARYGGDEFCAIEVCKNDKEAQELIDRLQSVFEEKNNASEYALSVSVGYASLQGLESMSPAQIVQRADKMMYENKRRRKES